MSEQCGDLREYDMRASVRAGVQRVSQNPVFASGIAKRSLFEVTRGVSFATVMVLISLVYTT